MNTNFCTDTLAMSCKGVLLATLSALALSSSASAQLITSFEGVPATTAGTPDGLGAPNGWQVPSFTTTTSSVSIGSLGASDGVSALAITMDGGSNGSLVDGFPTHFDRPAFVDSVGGALSTLFSTASETPALFELQFDVTIDPSILPSFSNVIGGGADPFIGIGLFANSDGGFNQSFNSFFTDDPSSIASTTTFTVSAPVSALGYVPDSSFYQLGFIFNGNWNAGEDLTAFIDNLQFVSSLPDLNGDESLDVLDWEIFIANHTLDISALSEQAQFEAGDLDGDGDNDFDDFVAFEQAFDVVNGAGALQAVIAGTSVPEPTGVALLAIGASVVLLRSRSRASSLVAPLLAMFVLGSAQSSHAQLLHSFEGGCDSTTSCDGWSTVTFGQPGVTFSSSSIGATGGSSSFGVTQPEDGFSWNAQATYGSGTANFQAFADAVDIGAEFFELRFDVTYDTGSIPFGAGAIDPFVNLSIALNSNAGFNGVDSLGGSTGTADETIPVAIPLSDFTLPSSSGTAGFFQINLGMNGNWGLSPATFFFDNFELVQTGSPPLLTLEVDRADGSVSIKNDTGGPIDFDYYEIASAGGALNPSGWSSLDVQNLDATDGDDVGAIAGDSALEGWDAAGGSFEGTDNLTEAFLLGSSSIADMASISLGAAYANTSGVEDLTFQYRVAGDTDSLATGNVVYVGVAPEGIVGDYNDDGMVSAADYATFRGSVGAADLPNSDSANPGPIGLADFSSWAANFGQPAPAVSAVAIPEPTAWIMVALSSIVGLWRKRRS